MKKLLSLFGILMLAAVAASAQTTPATTTKQTTTMTKTKTSAKQAKEPKMSKTKPTDDAGIQQCIEGKLAKSKMAGEGFAATVSGGAATFTGSTKVPGHKGGVSGIGKSCGAKSIVNNITIEGKTMTPKPPKTGTKMKSDSKMKSDTKIPPTK